MRFYTTQHQFYCGIDLAARSMSMCIMDQPGKILLHRNNGAEPVPVGATVTSAILMLKKTSGDVGMIDVDVHRLTDTWIETEATWDNRTSSFAWIAPGADYDIMLIAHTTVTSDMEYQWSDAALTSPVDDWHKGITGNYGVIIVFQDGGGQDRFFASRSHGITTSRPKLNAEYTIPYQ